MEWIIRVCTSIRNSRPRDVCYLIVSNFYRAIFRLLYARVNAMKNLKPALKRTKEREECVPSLSADSALISMYTLYRTFPDMRQIAERLPQVKWRIALHCTFNRCSVYVYRSRLIPRYVWHA